jgi:DNA-binding beta-propeller fold protein YncE
LAFVLGVRDYGRAVLNDLGQRFPEHRRIELYHPPGSDTVFAEVVLVEPVGLAAEQSIAPIAGALRQPRGVAVTPGGMALVADTGNHRIQSLARGGAFIRQFGGLGSEPGRFKEPTGIAVTPEGQVVVADTWNHRVQILTADGAFVALVEGEFFSPRGVAVAGDGRIYVADSGNNRIVVARPDGVVEHTFGSPGSGPGELAEPVGLAVGPRGDVYVVDVANGRVQIFAADVEVRTAIAIDGWRSAAFSEPYVAVADNGVIWVTVPMAGEVRGYGRDGALLHRLGPSDMPAGTLGVPLGIAYIPGQGTLVVTELADRVFRVRAPAAHGASDGSGRQAK